MYTSFKIQQSVEALQKSMIKTLPLLKSLSLYACFLFLSLHFSLYSCVAML